MKDVKKQTEITGDLTRGTKTAGSDQRQPPKKKKRIRGDAETQGDYLILKIPVLEVCG